MARIEKGGKGFTLRGGMEALDVGHLGVSA